METVLFWENALKEYYKHDGPPWFDANLTLSIKDILLLFFLKLSDW